MSILSLCTGTGVLDLAVEKLTGEKTTHVAELDENACKVLAHRFPEAVNIGDITQFTWNLLKGKIRVLVAGFPCQNISNMGNKEGLDGEKSGIWRNVAEAIRILRPEIVFLENVSAIRNRDRGLSGVLADLAAIGYHAQWICIRASDVGAPHERDRWFLVAVPADADSLGWEGGPGTSPSRKGGMNLRTVIALLCGGDRTLLR